MSSQQHRRTHNLLLLNKLLDCRDASSPFTLVVDSLKQSARPLLRDVVQRASKSNTRVIFISAETPTPPAGTTLFLRAHSCSQPADLERDLAAALSPAGAKHRTVVVFDALNTFLHTPSFRSALPLLLASLLSPSTSLLAAYHVDVPAPSDAYAPHPLSLLRHLATAVLAPHSPPHVLAAREARRRCGAEPAVGLAGGREGVVVGCGSNAGGGVVVEVEYRRRSGRAMCDVFFVPDRLNCAGGVDGGDGLVLLGDHPLYGERGAEGERVGDGGSGATFCLGLTERQRRDREGVVLPYFDAQGDGGVGEGGRILYDLGEEDDFDEEEDEI